ncbi:PAS domain S-box/diguanylate cyclase (GGDEF) domain-containing protein [Saccharomonospora marina XMU15]|uniref:PAS domain S-box/diguanylate cyclase (GGDEF) domain-containing protein n=1 Tax=Saccharomonospora marina XMU15 TaxID=882083 RepID=H5WXY0_9PSEU|nr:EAL domain-containing protein [Saccharomonospora marina]EHR52847.1 PAS domain S-box/diguanylate cyclase (GGDEF) domain-containing protein [Saccharomonospora marina XMU15]
MSVSLPHDSSPTEEKASRGSGHRESALLAHKWMHLLSRRGYLQLARGELERELLDTVERLFQIVLADPFEAGPAAAVGARLAESQCVDTDNLSRSVEFLGKALLHSPRLRGTDQPADRVLPALAALMSGYGDRQRLLNQRRQEELNQALLKVAWEARRKQQLSESTLDESFANSACGLALTELDGRFLRVNEALAWTLNRTTTEFAGRTLFEVVHPDDAAELREAYQELLDGRLPRLWRECRLVLEENETVRASLTASLVFDVDGKPRYLVTAVQDDSEIDLLQNQLSHQSLHDPLTGLPNRQYLSTHIERCLRRAGAETGVTLFHIGLDSFPAVANGLGSAVADRLVASVAERLSAAMAGENAMVARIGCGEFGILVENTPVTPDVATMVERIKEQLGEPQYLDGSNGLAAPVSIGVVHRPSRDTAPAELMRAADRTLRRARRGGRGQWQLLDEQQDARDRQSFSLAASMPGAWETGEVDLAFQPLVNLADGTAVGIEASLNWTHAELGTLPHDRCVELAEQTGLMLPLGQWLLRQACEEVAARHGEPALLLSARLTRHQAADPDLVAGVRRTLDVTGLPAARLRLGFPSIALAGGRGDAVDNLKVLAELGVEVALLGFGSLADLALLRDLPLNAVTVAASLVPAEGEPADEEEGAEQALTALLEAAHRAGASVLVDGVRTRRQAGRWRLFHADVALGPLYTEVPDAYRTSAARAADAAAVSR